MTEKVPPGRYRGVNLDADLWSAAPESSEVPGSPEAPEPAEPRDPPEAEADPFSIFPWLRGLPPPETLPRRIYAVPVDPEPPPGQDEDGPSSSLPGQDEDEPDPGSGTAVGHELELAPRSGASALPARRVQRAGTVSRVRAVPPPSRTPARERLRIERERKARRRRRGRVAGVSTGLAALAVAAAVTVVLQQRASAHDTIIQTGSVYSGPYAPVTVNSDGSVTMAQPGVTGPVLEVYEDFQCPPCRAFEKANGGVIEQLADLGRIKVVYYPFTIFSDEPQRSNSTRAWAAARCAPAQEWVSYHNALFASQPALTKPDGFPVSLLVRLGRNAGITSAAFTRCVQSQKYAPQDATFSDQVISNGPDGLPTLRLNGELLTVNPMSAGLAHQLVTASS